MQKLNDTIRKRLSQKFMGKQVYGSVVLHYLPKIMQSKNIFPGYVKNHILFVFAYNQQDKIMLFADKKNLLQKINNHTQELGYNQQLTDLRLLKKSPTIVPESDL